jgi:hypothetical protein
MPVKRRSPKRRLTVPPEDWAMAFESGFDFFNDLEPLGLVEPHNAPMGPEREAARAAWEAALQAAWTEHGPGYLAARNPRLQAAARPWALEQFGDPECQ